jgi:shikimate 5-dehydrogenase
MPEKLDGATRLFPIIGDPIKFVKSPQQLTRGFEKRGYNGLCSSMFVGDVIAGHGVTPLLKAAQSAGCKTANGVQMVDAVQEMMLDFLLG